jgi:hypothetical protein
VRYQRVGSLALRAYPPGFRSARGEEMLGTLLDAGDDSTGAFVRGFASLVVGGLRERVRENARIGAGRLIADAFCLAGVLWSLMSFLSWRPTPLGYAQFWSLATVVLLAAVLVFALMGRDRLGGLCGVVLAGHIGVRAFGHPGPQFFEIEFFLDYWLGPLVCFTVMVLRPRIRPRDPRKLLRLIPGAMVAAFFLIPHLGGVARATPESSLFVIPGLALELGLLLGMPILGIFLLPIDPRVAITSAVFWADLAVSRTLGHERLGLVTLPAVLLAVLLTVARQDVVVRRMRV